MAQQRQNRNQTNSGINSNSVAITIVESIDDTHLFDNNFSDIALDYVIDNAKFWSEATESAIISLDNKDWDLKIHDVSIEGHEGLGIVGLCINRALSQCDERGLELYVNGHFNPDLRVHKLEGYSDSKERYPNRLELYFA